jgi:superfamily I DNA and/or RNA helicase
MSLGNEDDYIIISVVRSLQLGFLQDVRRTNVMLTRCKKGMIICSSRAFLSRIAADTLVGKLAAHVGDVGWVTVKDLETADL